MKHSRMTRKQLNAAYEASRPAVKDYLAAVIKYHANEITDEEFITARRARDEALAAYDAAEAKFLAE